MERLKYLLILILSVFFVTPSLAAPEVKGCEGPAEICAQVRDLNQKIVELQASKSKDLDAKASAVVAAEDQKNSDRMQKVIAAAGVISVVLKMLLSGLASWKDFFTTDKGKAWLKLITVGVGLLTFVATNVGMGIPVWQALILAGGGPGAMAIHSLHQMIPVILGKGKLPPSSDPPGPPSPPPEKTA
jgi:hypothetical protein